MRIRKRQVPLPLSSLSPVPLPDPHLLGLGHCSTSSPSVQQQLLHTHDHDDPKPPHHNPSQRLHHVGPLQPSDHSPMQAPPSNGRHHDASGEKDCSQNLRGEEGEDGIGSTIDQAEKKNKGDDDRTGSISGAETISGFPSESSTSLNRVLGKWFEGEKAFPFKKRRGSFGKATRAENEEKLTKNNVVSSLVTTKKCDDQQSDDKKQDIRDITTKQGSGSSTSPKKRARGNAIKEGSRCSRVNGRGWRCCQQTLVGYSLCEHHLGKGRLRSLNSVRSRSLAVSIGTKSKQQLSTSSSVVCSMQEESKPAMLLDHAEDQRPRNEIEIGEERKPVVVTKKRMKLGVVKARSMSSLLGQTNRANASAVEAENNE